MYIFKRIMFYVLLVVGSVLLSGAILILINPPTVNMDGFGLIYFLMITIMFLLIFGINYLRNNRLKIVEIIIVIIISLGITISVTIPAIVEKIEHNKKINNGYTLVNEYLKNKFGNDNFKSIKVSFSSYDDGCHIICTDLPVFNYEVSSKMIKSNFTVVVEEKRGNCNGGKCSHYLSVENDTFISELVTELETSNGKKFEYEYLKQVLNDTNLPDNVEISGFYHIYEEKIDFSKNNSFDDIFKNSGYHINSFTIRLNNYSKEEAIKHAKIIYVFYNNIQKELYDNSAWIFFHVWDISLNDWMANGQARPYEQSKLEITLNPYFNGNGVQTIEKSVDLVELPILTID